MSIDYTVTSDQLNIYARDAAIRADPESTFLNSFLACVLESQYIPEGSDLLLDHVLHYLIGWM